MFQEDIDFHQDQARCKGCSGMLRPLANVAKSQKFSKELEKMKQTDFQQYERLLKSYAKVRDESSKIGQRIKFPWLPSWSSTRPGPVSRTRLNMT